MLKNLGKKVSFIFFFTVVLFGSMAVANPVKIELNSGWKFRQGRGHNWYPATVPGVIHTDLMANKIIEDPFFRLNERAVQWVDKEDWMYETHFDASEEILSKENIRLYFKGLDTYADVYLNGQSILNANNMFREWKVNIKDKLKAKDNKLEVYFHSPIKIDIPKWDALPFSYPTGPDQSQHGGIFNKTVSTFARKAGYHYGWDWGPRLVTSGIWRSVSLEAWDNAKIENIFIEQKDVNQKKAVVVAHAEILADKDLNGAQISVKDKDNGKVYGTLKADLKKGLNNIKVDFIISNPNLWWSNGLGKANLYSFVTTVDINGKKADEKVTRTGIRSIKVINEKDKYGMSLYFELNGIPVFAKGANFVPADNFLPRVTPEIYKKAVMDAVNANMNMLRVWGGGIYESDDFYNFCDENGIMVWQDFMFACSMYPSEGAMLENIKHEAIDNIKRLRNHPSISIWCGNNEAYDGWFGWGRREDYAKQNPEYARIMWKQYTDLFHKLLPDMVEQYAPGMKYWPSSPFGLSGQACDDHNGDRHYWDVWHGRKPISEYNVERSRFFSEYGFQSFPEFESVKVYAPNPEDWKITSEVMMDHQRAGNYANQLIEEYLLNEYQKPKNFESFLYMNQVLQGDAIKIAMEAHRRDMPYCMGTLFWQHNDCWPVASWSSRDYYGRWKAQHYFAKKAYRDVLLSPIAKGNQLDVFVVSDRLKASGGTFSLKVMKLDGTEIFSATKHVKIAANTSKSVYSENLVKLLKGVNKDDLVVVAELKEGKNLYKNNYFLVKQKDVNFPKATIKTALRKVDDGYELTLSSEKFARAVFLSIDGIDNFFEDNYFDILPNQSVKVKVTSALSPVEFEKQLKVVSLSDAY